MVNRSLCITNVFLIICLFISNSATSQKVTDKAEETAPPKVGEPKVRLDINGASFLDPLPFDVPFKIYGLAYDENLIAVKLYFKKQDQKSKLKNTDLKATWENRIDQKSPLLLYVLDPLKPNTIYDFKFEVKRKLSDEEISILNKLVSEQFFLFLNKQLSSKIDFELKTTDIDKIASDATIALNAFLSQRGLKLAEGSLKSHYGDLLIASMQELTDFYEGTYHSPLKILSENAAFLEGRIAFLIGVSKEKGFAITEPFKTLQRNLAGLSTLAKVIDPDKALDGPSIDRLLSHTGKILENLQISVAPKSLNFKKDLPDFKDLIGYIDSAFKEYKNGPKNGKPIIERNAQLMANALSSIIYSNITVIDNTDGDFERRANFYLSADIGVALFPTIGRASPYLGTNIYLRPVNKQKPIYRNPYNVFSCFSFLVGVSFISISETGKRENLIGSNFNLLSGVGYRITDHIRLNGGFVFYKDIHKNPLGGKEQIGINGFCSLSFDWDINSTFKTIFSPNLPK